MILRFLFALVSGCYNLHWNQLIEVKFSMLRERARNQILYLTNCIRELDFVFFLFNLWIEHEGDQLTGVLAKAVWIGAGLSVLERGLGAKLACYYLLITGAMLTLSL